MMRMRAKKPQTFFTPNYFVQHKNFNLNLFKCEQFLRGHFTIGASTMLRRRCWYINFNSKLLTLTSFGPRQFKYFYYRVFLEIIITLHNWCDKEMTFMENWKNIRQWFEYQLMTSITERFERRESFTYIFAIVIDAKETEKHNDVTVSINVFKRQLVFFSGIANCSIMLFNQLPALPTGTYCASIMTPALCNHRNRDWNF